MVDENGGAAAGEGLLLSLLNTALVVDGTRQDVLSGPAARDWLRAQGGTGTALELAATVAARDALQDVVRGAAAATALVPLLEDVRLVPRIGPAGVEWTTEVEPPRRLAVAAVLAWDEVQRSKEGRLRPCANPECAQFLLDRSKANTARWCSMAVCGNRMKARRHQQRSRTQAEPAPPSQPGAPAP